MLSPSPVRFSAILVNYNHGRFIANALNAAMRQTMPFDEILIIDDASTDDSIKVIKAQLQSAPNARLLQNPQNLGVIGTCNRGLQEARGDFIFYMAADDDYSLGLVESWRAALAAYPDVAMISGNTRIRNYVTNKERLFVLPFSDMPGRYTRADIETAAKRRAFTFNIGANVMRRDAIIAAGGLLPDLHWHCDWFLYLLIAIRYPFAVLPQEFACIRESGGQYSRACFNWRKQKPVIQAFIRILENDYPDAYEIFRQAALLPTYDLETLGLCLADPALRRYLTPLLCWRLLTYKLWRMGRKLCPDFLRAPMRRFLRV